MAQYFNIIMFIFDFGTLDGLEGNENHMRDVVKSRSCDEVDQSTYKISSHQFVALSMDY